MHNTFSLSTRRRFGASEIHLSPQVASATFRSKEVVLLLFIHCLLLPLLLMGILPYLIFSISMVFRWQADNCQLFVVYGVSLPSTKKLIRQNFLDDTVRKSHITITRHQEDKVKQPVLSSKHGTNTEPYNGSNNE